MRRWVPVALACVLAQLASFAHIAVVRHVRCAEHGEWVHADASVSDDRVASSFAAAADAVVEPRFTSTPSADDHDHDHCGAVSEHRSMAEATATVDSIRRDHPPRASTAASPPRASRARVDVVRIAPKTSPPRTAVVLA